MDGRSYKTPRRETGVDVDGHKKLTDEEIEEIKQQLLDSIYKDIGKSLVKKFLWVLGAVVLAALAWLNGSGHIKIG